MITKKGGKSGYEKSLYNCAITVPINWMWSNESKCIYKSGWCDGTLIE